MEIPVDLRGLKRKTLAQLIGKHLDAEAVYKRPPSYAYDIGAVTVDRYGVVSVPDDINKDLLNLLLSATRESGFGVEWEPEAEAAPEQEPEPESSPMYSVQLPLDGFTEASLENLRLLIASKALLIKKSLGVNGLFIEKAEGVLNFPWFERKLTAAEVAAYTDFLTLLADMAKRQSRVLATEKPVENEKYAFRCFLLRLGMIGEQYSETRRILLCNLTGNGSMKSGEHKPPKEREQSAPISSAPLSIVPAPILVSEPELPVEDEPSEEPGSPPPKQKDRFFLKRLFGGLKLW